MLFVHGNWQIPILLAFAIGIAFAQQTTVAVLPSEGVSLGNDELEALTDKMRETALKVLPTDAFVLLKQDVVVRRLGGAENYIKECKESSCIVDLGKKAQVDYVVQASVGKLGDKIRLKVELYNVRTEGLIGMLNDEAENIRGLLAIVEKKAPEVFSKIDMASYIKLKKDEPAGEIPFKDSAPACTEAELGNNMEWVGETFTDSRDGKKYRTVKIGEQVWMAENLNYNASGSKCYGNKTENCDKYGSLYNWSAAKKVCPNGWHLPSNVEWAKLYRFADNDNSKGTLYESKTAGKYLKTKCGWSNYEGKSGNGENKFGFSALPGGVGSSANGFLNAGYSGYWWSASEYSAYFVYYRIISYNGEYASFDHTDKAYLFSVRCLQD
jgi:uncharacterized protein (TIGR02145 family)